MHRLGGAYVEPVVSAEDEPAVAGAPLSVRVQRLEEQVATLMGELHELKAKLGE